ncbi:MULTISPECIES: hypothetical protein [unclassified Acinetobacter]|uniref:hypothetical protein n=1 Tax=unclassified Acinetobacter TaxID=196816 RepID=UPI0035B86CF4
MHNNYIEVLKINDLEFSCKDKHLSNNARDCDKIYQYGGKQAQIWYDDQGYYDFSDERVIYQVEVDGKYIYDFNQQLKNVEKQHKNKKFGLWLAFWLILLPAPWFIYHNFRLSRILLEGNSSEIQRITQTVLSQDATLPKEVRLKNLLNNYLKANAIGFMIVVSIFSLSKNGYLYMLAFLIIVMILASVVLYFIQKILIKNNN